MEYRFECIIEYILVHTIFYAATLLYCYPYHCYDKFTRLTRFDFADLLNLILQTYPMDECRQQALYLALTRCLAKNTLTDGTTLNGIPALQE